MAEAIDEHIESEYFDFPKEVKPIQFLPPSFTINYNELSADCREIIESYTKNFNKILEIMEFEEIPDETAYFIYLLWVSCSTSVAMKYCIENIEKHTDIYVSIRETEDKLYYFYLVDPSEIGRA